MSASVSELPVKRDILAELKKPFKESEVHWRTGSTNKKKNGGTPTKGLPLAYIDARDVMKRLDDVLGIDGWQDHYEETPKGRIICSLRCRINGEWITKSDGAGETFTEGEKGAISDAFKRAAVKFGIGRYLYYIKMSWVDVDEWGNLKERPKLPKWAMPSE